MGGRLAGCGRAVVTIVAAAGDGGVIDIGRRPGVGGMAVVTGVGRSDMGGRLARRGAAVVTAVAAAGQGTVINIGRRPGVGGMADITLGGR